MTNNHQTIVGTAAGAGTALGKAISTIIEKHELITMDSLVATAAYALVGAVVGFLATEALKYLKSKLINKNKNGKISP